jgi:hypothetical protein
MLKAYLDESEQEAGLWCVAGCVTPLENWGKFDSAWQCVLDSYQVPWHHQVDWTHTTAHFSKWKGDKDTKEAYQGNLLRIMDHFVLRYVGAVIPGKAYNALREDQQRIIHSPYLPCLQLCLHAAALQAKDEAEGVMVDVTIAERPGLRGKARELYDLALHYLPIDARSRLSPNVTICRMPKGKSNEHEKPTLPLQAADLVAYELGQYALGKKRYPMTQLMKTKDHYYWHIFDKIALNEFCQPWVPEGNRTGNGDG